MGKSELLKYYLEKFKLLSYSAKLVLDKFNLTDFDNFFHCIIINRYHVSFSSYKYCGEKTQKELDIFTTEFKKKWEELKEITTQSSTTRFSEQEVIEFEKNVDKLSIRTVNILLSLGALTLDGFTRLFLNKEEIINPLKIRNCGIKTLSEINNLKEKIESLLETSSEKLNDSPPTEKIINIDISQKKKEIHFNADLQLFFNYNTSKLSQRAKNILINSQLHTLDSFVNYFILSQNSIEKIKFRNCGLKTTEEISTLINLIEDKIEHSNEEFIPKGIFNDFKSYLKKGDILTEPELYLFYHYYSFEIGHEKYSIEKIGKLMNLSTERIRQISKKVIDKIKQITQSIFGEFIKHYHSYFVGEYFVVDDKYINEINSKEDTKFSKQFVALVLESLNNPEYYYCSETQFPYEQDGIFVKNIIAYEFNWLYNFITSNRKTKITIDTVYEFTQLKSKLAAEANDENLTQNNNFDLEKAINFILKTIDPKKREIEANTYSIVFKSNSKASQKDIIRSILNEKKMPMHYTELYNECKKRNIKIGGPINVHSILTRNSEVFGLKGPGTYGLKEWGGYFGTIGDVAEIILKTKNQPIAKNELFEILSRELYVTKDSLNTVLFNYHGENRFLKSRNNMISLKSWSEIK